MPNEPGLPRWRSLTRAGVLISAGLVVQAVTLYWSHPTAFLVFIGLGGSLVAAGIVLYLWGLLVGTSDAAKP